MKLASLVLIAVILASACIQQNPATNRTEIIIPGIQPPPPPAPQVRTDDMEVGAVNHAYLQPAHAVIIEIDYVQGYDASSSTKAALRDFFASVAGKGVAFSGGNVIASSKNVYSLQDLLDIEKANRQHYSDEKQAVIYLLFMNGRFESEGALGVAYKASTAAMFPDRMNDATSSLVFYQQIERAVVIHETGHLMGLVNINYKSERDHEDASHPKHSKNDESVMYWAVEDISLKQLLRFGPPGSFDEDDLFDMAKIREGTY